ncbi:M61 family peptidase [Sulfolobus tengchongensis]|uniref:M61 family peptidase n=1 Tax=Sulfolobus tengchongensis TaxID=207809 RepID=A0AAX4L308_9CREN
MKFYVNPKNRYLEVFAEGIEGIITFPTWVPGSYIIRELERNIIEIEGIRVGKNRFYVKDKFRYLVQAMSRDPREAIATNDYLFINPPAVFPFHEIEEEYCVRINTNWIVHTTLKRVGDWFCSENYNEFADSPIQASPKLKLIEIDSYHKISTIDDLDESFVNSLGKCLKEINRNIFMNSTSEEYIFFFKRSDSNFGGIEHEKSSSIVTSWDYKDLISLFVHEYFHRYNGKKIKPKDLKINYESETYTELLWVVEGLTDYISLVVPLRTKVTTVENTLNYIANVLAWLTFPGIRRMSLAESSYTTWIKYYRRDNNFANVSVSYYQLGMVIGLIMDLEMIENGNSIYDLFKELYKIKEYTYDNVRQVAEKLGVKNLDELVFSRNPPIFDRLSKYFEITFIDKDTPYYGMIMDGKKVTFVEDNSPADLAGIIQGDEIIGVNGLAFSNKRLEYKENLRLTIDREGRLIEIVLHPAKNPGHNLVIKGKGDLFKQWSDFEYGEGKSDIKII